MDNYVIIIAQTNRGRVWEVRKRGRILWKDLGKFKTEAEAEKCVSDNIGEHGGTLEYAYVDKRTIRGFRVWVLEYKTYRRGEFRKEREEFLWGWEARLHRWLYGFDSSKLDLKIYREDHKTK